MMKLFKSSLHLHPLVLSILAPLTLLPSIAASKIIDLNLNGEDIKLVGGSASDYVGHAVTLGDVNGDGKDDAIIAAPGFDYLSRTNCGTIYIILADDSLPGTIDLSAGGQPFLKRIIGPATMQNVGASVTTGDVNGDGKRDIIWGMPWASPSGRFWAGEVAVILGSSSLPDTLDLFNSPGGTTIFYGASMFDKVGGAICAGDMNSDGMDDIIAGAPLASPLGRSSAGELFLIFGSQSYSSTVDLASTTNGISRIFGERAADTFGNSCALADLDGDGFQDIIAGASNASPLGRQTAGSAFVIFGSDAIPDTIDMIGTSVRITRFLGPTDGALAGTAVSAGDATGDGTPDVIVSAIDYSLPGRSKAGAVYIINGLATIADTLDLATSLGVSSLLGPTSDSHIGISLDVGDLNFDNIDDVIIGAPKASPLGRSSAGEVIIVFGRTVFPQDIDLGTLQGGVSFVYGAQAGDYTGGSVAAGDMNGDGFEDLIIGSRSATVSDNQNAGVSSIIKGNPDITPALLLSHSLSHIAGGVQLRWSISESVEISGFNVKRMDQNGRIEELWHVEAIGRGHYTLVDLWVLPGATYTYTVLLQNERLFTDSISIPGYSPLALLPNDPNPFSSSTLILFTIPEAGYPSIRIYDVTGSLVANLGRSFFAAGRNSILWNGQNQNGELLPSGVYFVNIRFQGKSAGGKTVLIR